MNDKYWNDLKFYLDILNDYQREIVLEYVIEMYHQSEDAYDNDNYNRDDHFYQEP